MFNLLLKLFTDSTSNPSGIEGFINGYEGVLHAVAKISVITLDFIGIAIIIIGTIRSIVLNIQKARTHNNRNIKIDLGQSLALGLEFKMGAEIINTVIAKDLNELTILAFIICLRAILAILIHWEIKVEKKEAKEHQVFEQSKVEGEATLAPCEGIVNKIEKVKDAIVSSDKEEPKE